MKQTYQIMWRARWNRIIKYVIADRQIYEIIQMGLNAQMLVQVTKGITLNVSCKT